MLKWLKENKALVAVLLLALAGRIHFECTYVDFNMDKARQLFIAQCFTEGHGFSTWTADPADLSQSTCKRIHFWPPGYPLLIAGLDALFNDAVLSTIVLDLLGLLVLFYAFHTLLRVLDLGKKAYILFMVFTAFAFTPYFYLGSTDFLSSALYLLAVALTLDHVDGRPPRTSRFILIGAAVCGAAFFRYAYYPFMVIIPSFLFLYGLWRKDKPSIHGSLITAAASFMPLAGLVTYYKHYFGAAFFMRPSDGFFPEHVLHIDSFPAKSFLYMEVLEKNLALGPLFRPAALLLSLFVLAALVYHFVRGKSKDAVWSFYALLFMTLAVNVGMLAYYAVKNPPHQGLPEFWTYVMETRYYAPCMFLIQIGLFVAVFKGGGSRMLKYGAGSFLVAAVAFSMVFGLHRAYKVHFRNAPTFLDDRLQEIAGTLEIIDGLQSDRVVYADWVCVTGVSVHDECLVAMASPACIVQDYDGLVSGDFQTSSPVVLLVNMPKNLSEEEQRIMERYAPKCLYEDDRSTLYRFDLP